MKYSACINVSVFSRPNDGEASLGPFYFSKGNILNSLKIVITLVYLILAIPDSALPLCIDHRGNLQLSSYKHWY